VTALRTTARPVPRLGGRVRDARRAAIGWGYAAPAALVFGLLFVLPVGLAGWMSLHDWPLLADPEWNFPDNYTAMPDDALLSGAISFTATYTVIITVVLIGLGLVLALIVQESRRPGVGLLRTAYFVPAVVGLTASALLFYGLYSPSIGPLDPLLRTLGIVEDRVDWLGTPTGALLSTVLMMTWRFAGFYMLILLTGLQAIPRELYEAAYVDGATRAQVFRRVTLPLLRPQIALCLVLIVTGGWLAFEQFYVLTKGGPDNSTVTVVIAMFRQAFTQFDLGGAAAIAVLLLVALVILNVVQLAILRRRD
jgi:multiple sugar transport system permease protein